MNAGNLSQREETDMRIGNLDEQHNADGLIELIEASGPDHMTRSQKRKNWWHYYKWYVIIGVILSAALLHLIGTSLGLFTKSPDLQIAYVGAQALPDDTVTALEQVFASLIEDFNGDGEVIVQVNQYTDGSSADDAEASYYQYASEVTLIADISSCESYLFLLEDPRSFQREFQILAEPDGSCPGDADYSVDGKVICWAECPLLSSADLGSYTILAAGLEITGSSQELLSGLCVGRRCFYNDKATDNREACDSLWQLLSNSQQNEK